MAEPRVVEVTWIDHAFWFGDYDPKRSGTVITKTVGFLADKDKATIKVALNRSEDGDLAEVQAIDRRLVTKMRYLT